MRDDSPSSPSNPSRREFLRTTGGSAAAAVVGGMRAGAAGRPARGSCGRAEHRGRGPGHAAHQRQGPPAPRRPADDAARLPPRDRRPHRNEEGLRPRAVRRLHGARERPARELVPEPGPDARRATRSRPSRASARPTRCTRCRRRSSPATGTSAGIARPARSCRPSRLLKEPCGPDDAAVKELMSGNICRCGAYPNIVAAIQQVRKNG